MKRFNLKKGDVLEVPLPKNEVGYVRVIGKDDFGTMFQVFGRKFKEPIDECAFDETDLPLEAVVYINGYSARSGWKLRFRGKDRIDELPKSFYGSPDRWWFVNSGDNVQKISPKEVTYDQMVAAGYVHKTLWLSKDIENALAFGKPLKWPQWSSTHAPVCEAPASGVTTGKSPASARTRVRRKF